jgi:DNA-directed RNA polymerase specialized sigma24 family protein
MVLRFCELFLGDTRLAEQATIETFVRFLGSSHRGETSGVPVALLSLAFRVVSQSSTANPERLEPLKGATLGLDPQARAVFILHAVLSIQWPWIGAILGLSSEQVTDVWAKTLLRIRERLPEDFFKEQRR